MAITAEDIQNQSFNVDRRGYDVDEVDVFLEHVAAEIDIMNAHIAELEQAARDGYVDMDSAFAEPALPGTDEEVAKVKADLAAEIAEKDARIAELEAMVEEKNDDSSAIAAALVSAQRTAKDIIDKADKEAAEIIADAKNDAEVIVNKAESTRDRIETDIADLDAMHDDTCDAFALALQEFVDDANEKLEFIARAKAKVKPSAALNHARYNSPAQAPFHQNMDGAMAAPAFGSPVVNTAATVVPATPMPSTIEKDLSGFGDASDFMGFDDID